MPPLFSRDTPEGKSPARSRLPVAYSEGTELFSMSEEEVRGGRGEGNTPVHNEPSKSEESGVAVAPAGWGFMVVAVALLKVNRVGRNGRGL